MPLLPLILLALALLATVAQAKSACVFEGTLQGKPIKDCSEIDLPVPVAEYRLQCEKHVDAFKRLGGEIRAYVAPACPKPALAGCKGAMGTPGTVYYYLASPTELANKQAACAKYGGSWLSGS